MEFQNLIDVINATDAPTVVVLLFITYWMKTELSAQREFYESLIKKLTNGDDDKPD